MKRTDLVFLVQLALVPEAVFAEPRAVEALESLGAGTQAFAFPASACSVLAFLAFAFPASACSMLAFPASQMVAPAVEIPSQLQLVASEKELAVLPSRNLPPTQRETSMQE